MVSESKCLEEMADFIHRKVSGRKVDGNFMTDDEKFEYIDRMEEGVQKFPSKVSEGTYESLRIVREMVEYEVQADKRLEEGNFNDAVNLYEKALQMNPSSEQILEKTANTYAKWGSHEFSPMMGNHEYVRTL